MAMGLTKDDDYILSDADVVAFGIIYSGFEGNEFDMATMSFKDSK